MNKILSSKHIKIISWLAIIGSAFTLILLVWALFAGQQTINFGSIIVVILIGVGAYGGWLTLKDEHLGKKLLVAFYAPQLISFYSQSFYFSFNTGISFSVNAGTSNGSAIGFNFYALVMLLLCIRMLREHDHLTRRSSKDAVNGDA